MQATRYCDCTPDCDVPYGYCHCRQCGEKTTVSPQTVRKLGYVKGEPRPYVRNHDKRRTDPQYVVAENGCWVWQWSLNHKGYGEMRPRGSKTMKGAHIVYYERAKGPVPEGKQVGHICHDNDPSCPGGPCVHRRCVNPDHLMAQTNTENQRGGRKPKLTIEIVREIRSRPQTYGSRLALAREFGIAPSTVSLVRNQPDRVWVDE